MKPGQGNAIVRVFAGMLFFIFVEQAGAAENQVALNTRPAVFTLMDRAKQLQDLDLEEPARMAQLEEQAHALVREYVKMRSPSWSGDETAPEYVGVLQEVGYRMEGYLGSKDRLHMGNLLGVYPGMKALWMLTLHVQYAP